MSRWSESVYSEPNSSRSTQHGFLHELDACLYEGVSMQDPQLDAEAREWAARFVHLRVLGRKYGIPCLKQVDGTRSAATAVRHYSLEKSKQTPTRTERSQHRRSPSLKQNSKQASQPRNGGDHLPKLPTRK